MLPLKIQHRTQIKGILEFFRNLVQAIGKYWKIMLLNPIPAEVLENQDTLGGGSICSPPLNPMFDVQIWQMIHHWKAIVLYFKNLQKNLQICKNWIFFCKIQLNSKNVCKKKIVQKIINYTFLKSPWPCHFKYANKFAKFYITWCVIKKN